MKRRVFLVLMTLELLTGWLWVENRTLQTDVVTVTSETLPPSFDGLRIVALADLHGQEFGRDQGRLLAAVERAEPDIIVLDGDLLSDTADFPMAETLALGLAALAPTYYVTGNHEWASGCARPLMTLLENCGVTVLENTWVRLERDGDSILLAGVNDPNGPYDQTTPEELVSALRAAEGEGWLLVACHRNDRLDQWSALGADLVLSGHGHGGVIRLPGLGGLLGTDRTLFPVFDAGLFGKNGTQMAVSRGLGSAGRVPRLGNRPQVLVVELNCKLS